MGNPVVHFGITGQDGESLKKFYGELFDWNIDSSNPQNYGFVAAEEGGVGGAVAAAQQGPGMLTIYVATDDTASRARSRWIDPSRWRRANQPDSSDGWSTGPRSQHRTNASIVQAPGHPGA